MKIGTIINQLIKTAEHLVTIAHCHIISASLRIIDLSSMYELFSCSTFRLRYVVANYMYFGFHSDVTKKRTRLSGYFKINFTAIYMQIRSNEASV
jgi:hypothetical protein